jgi:hypothetical protein
VAHHSPLAPCRWQPGPGGTPVAGTLKRNRRCAGRLPHLSWQTAAALTVALMAETSPAKAGLLAPMLQWIRPQLESRLVTLCLDNTAGSNPNLRRYLQDPCQKLAGPTSRCLIEETDHSGKGFEVMREMVGGRFGDASEVVVKRCLARMFGLPPESLREVPLRELGRRFGSAGQAGGTAPAP